jgi:hypothetical protein
MRRCRKCPCGTDFVSSLIVCIVLMVVIVYYITPTFEKEQEKSDLSRAQSHLRKIVTLNKRKHELSIEVNQDDEM